MKNPVYEQIQTRKVKARLRMPQHGQRVSGNVSQTCRFFGVSRALSASTITTTPRPPCSSSRRSGSISLSLFTEFRRTTTRPLDLSSPGTSPISASLTTTFHQVAQRLTERLSGAIRPTPNDLWKCPLPTRSKSLPSSRYYSLAEFWSAAALRETRSIPC